MACVPAIAIEKLFSKVGKAIDDMELIETNEALAAVTLVSLNILSKDNPDKLMELQQKTSVNGGAIAMGRPVGASGARITMTLMYELTRTGGGPGVVAVGGGLSQGEAVLLKV